MNVCKKEDEIWLNDEVRKILLRINNSDGQPTRFTVRSSDIEGIDPVPKYQLETT
jgi:hypothetical protein